MVYIQKNNPFKSSPIKKDDQLTKGIDKTKMKEIYGDDPSLLSSGGNIIMQTELSDVQEKNYKKIQKYKPNLTRSQYLRSL